MNDIESRLRRLERANRALLAGLIAVGVVPLAMAAGQERPGELVGSVLRIVDRAGKPRIVASVGADGPSLTFKDARGHVLLWIDGDDGDPSISVGTEDESGRVEIGQHRGGPGRIRIRDADRNWTFDTAK